MSRWGCQVVLGREMSELDFLCNCCLLRDFAVTNISALRMMKYPPNARKPESAIVSVCVPERCSLDENKMIRQEQAMSAW